MSERIVSRARVRRTRKSKKSPAANSNNNIVKSTADEKLRARINLPASAEDWASAEERAQKAMEFLKLQEAQRQTSLQSLTNMTDQVLAKTGSQVFQIEAMLSAFNSVPAFESMSRLHFGNQYMEIDKEVAELVASMMGRPVVPALETFQTEARKKPVTEQGTKAPKAKTRVTNKLERTLSEKVELAPAQVPTLEKVQETQLKLEGFATKVNREICRLEKEVTLEVTSESLTSLGYQVENRGDAIKATHGKTAIWAKADAHGQLEMDMSGFTGKECLAERKRVEEKLAQHGLELEVVHHDHHGKPRGGVLAQNLEPVFNPFHAIKGDFAVTQKDCQKVRA